MKYIDKLNKFLNKLQFVKSAAYRAGYKDAIADCKSIIRKEALKRSK